MPKVDKSQRANVSGIERRAYPVQLEVRGATGSGPTVVEGYASATEAPYEMFDMLGPYTEVIRAGAFGKTLSENPQVQLLLNHGGLSMAYTRAGTLALAEDSTGLHMRAEVNPTRGDVRDLLTALDDRAIDEMSFAFRVPAGKSVWSPDFDQRDITEVDMHRGDVSVVNFGANPTTSVAAMRAQDFDRLPADALRELMARLEKRLQVVVVDTGDDDEEDDDTQVCPSCGEGNEEDAVFCDQCGAAMTAPTAGLLAPTRSQAQRHDVSLYEAELILLG
jgi:HK97 family phage prohead protease